MIFHVTRLKIESSLESCHISHVIFTLCSTAAQLIYGTLVWFTKSSMVYNVKVFHSGDGRWLLNRLQSVLCRRVVFAQTPSGKTILSGKTIFKFLSSIGLQGFSSIMEVKAVNFWKDCKFNFVEGWSLLRCISRYSDPSGKTIRSGKTIFQFLNSTGFHANCHCLEWLPVWKDHFFLDI